MESSDEDVALILLIAAAGNIHQKTKKKRKKRTVWVKPWLSKRPKLGIFSCLLEEMRLEDKEGYKNYLRMSEEYKNL